LIDYSQVNIIINSSSCKYRYVKNNSYMWQVFQLILNIQSIHGIEHIIWKNSWKISRDVSTWGYAWQLRKLQVWELQPNFKSKNKAWAQFLAKYCGFPPQEIHCIPSDDQNQRKMQIPHSIRHELVSYSHRYKFIFYRFCDIGSSYLSTP